MINDEELKRCVPLARNMTHLTELIDGFPQSVPYRKRVLRRIQELKLDASHFNRKKAAPRRKHSEEFLVKNENKRRVGTKHLRKAMIDVGFKEECAGADCGLGTVWKGKKLVLQIDHINGDPSDNRKNNLRFLCPNCHSQTENFVGNGKKKDLQVKLADI